MQFNNEINKILSAYLTNGFFLALGSLVSHSHYRMFITYNNCMYQQTSSSPKFVNKHKTAFDAKILWTKIKSFKCALDSI